MDGQAASPLRRMVRFCFGSFRANDRRSEMDEGASCRTRPIDVAQDALSRS